MATDQPALVGIVPRKSLWPIIQSQRWYHIPVKSSPRNVLEIKYLAFYFPAVFGEKLKYRVIYYAPVFSINTIKRIKLFPKEKTHPRKNEDYYQIHLGEIKKLTRPIPSRKLRRIVHIPTTLHKLLNAREINDLYDTSPLEDRMYQALKRKKIDPERQMYVNLDNQFYCLDFFLACEKAGIDIECDGEKYHNLPDALTRDRLRNNHLTSHGWHVLRFGTKEINENIETCLNVIERTIQTLNGLKK